MFDSFVAAFKVLILNWRIFILDKVHITLPCKATNMMGLNLHTLIFHHNNKKKECALHTDRPVFEFPNHTAEFPNQWLRMIKM